ncbi:DUF2514 family protein [Allopusillimonas soli]|uniref:DUF2514 family protein n=1 Tax=Allopusillimonas soli TaxID=659016 RepID=A0A853F7S4_9BURK|nr:DUF2514 family protein [Allopusillimonas soli]TEA75985.1 DUF2514 family protein [Allopusillimonas soli]
MTNSRQAQRDKAQQAARSAYADTSAARSNDLGLHKGVDQILADARSRDPTLANGGPLAGSTLDLLAYMLGQSIERNVELTAYAGKARISGLTCERTCMEIISSDGY